MALLEGNVFSKVLGMDTGLTVYLPQGSRNACSGDRPVLYLLHGLSDNHSTWVRNSMAALYAEQVGMALVCPEVQRSFYMDMDAGAAYFTYIAEELPRMCRDLFHITDDPAKTYIAGNSMGGYGALKAALRYPKSFAAAGSFSGAVDVKARFQAESFGLSLKERAGAVGDAVQAQDDLLMLTARAVNTGYRLPSLYLTCGLSDFLYEDNKRFRQQLDFLHIPYAYEEWAGEHNWSFWNTSIQRFLQFLGN